MTYANAAERRDLIDGLRVMASFLTDHPDVPAPRFADVMVFPEGTDPEKRASIDEIASHIGTFTHDATAQGGHYTTSRSFGPVEYRAVAIPASKPPVRSDNEQGGTAL